MSIAQKILGFLNNIEVYNWRKTSTTKIDFRSCRWSGLQQIREKGGKYRRYSSFFGKYVGIFFLFKEQAPENKQGFYYYVFSFENIVGPFESPEDAFNHKIENARKMLIDKSLFLANWFLAHPEYKKLIRQEITKTKSVFQVKTNLKPFVRMSGWYYAQSFFKLHGPYKTEWEAQKKRYETIIEKNSLSIKGKKRFK